ncbi:MAG: hypothetical protein H6835_06600 [Planctomycetes bacterium]|nr:hypothetical protein [Planctomycetota bacterium]
MSDRSGFRYWRDPLCVGAAVVYALNRYWWKPLLPGSASFVHGYLGDVLLLPVLVPIALAVQRRLGLRAHDGPPTVVELLVHWMLWSWCFEWLGPRLPALAPGAVADPWDLLAYAAGGMLAALWWRGGFCARGHFAGAVPVVQRATVALALSLPVLGAYHAAPGGCLALDAPRRPEDAAAHAKLERHVGARGDGGLADAGVGDGASGVAR